MAHFAKIENGIVLQTIVAEQNVIDSGVFGDPGTWIQTSYNTHNNQHQLGGTPLRGNFAGVGDIYDAKYDVFYRPQEYASWTMNKNTWTWEAPIPYPDDGKFYAWDEEQKKWILFPTASTGSIPMTRV
jgi:hypothetical protein